MLRLRFPGGRQLEISPGFFGMLCLFWELSGTGEHGAMALLLAIFLHESGHLLAFLAAGIPVQRLTLSWSGAAIRPRPGIYPFSAQLLTLLAGSAASFLWAGVTALLPLPDEYMWMQLFCGGFSLLPLPGLDGGEIAALLAGRWFPGNERGLTYFFRAVKLLLAALLMVACVQGGSFLPMVWCVCLLLA